MLEKIALVPVFLAFFGVLFLITGFSRLSGVATESKKGEALLWGTIGLILGVLFIAGAVAFVLW
jgi:amino acid transporter